MMWGQGSPWNPGPQRPHVVPQVLRALCGDRGHGGVGDKGPSCRMKAGCSSTWQTPSRRARCPPSWSPASRSCGRMGGFRRVLTVLLSISSTTRPRSEWGHGGHNRDWPGDPWQAMASSNPAWQNPSPPCSWEYSKPAILHPTGVIIHPTVPFPKPTSPILHPTSAIPHPTAPVLHSISAVLHPPPHQCQLPSSWYHSASQKCHAPSHQYHPHPKSVADLQPHHP